MRKNESRLRQFKAYLVLGLLLPLGLILIVSTVGPKEFNAPRKFVFEMIATAQSGVSKVTGYCRSLWDGYVALWNVRDENKQLRDELFKYKALSNEYREAAVTNIRLNKLLKLSESLPTPTITAQIVGHDPSLWFRTVVINRGTSSGVEKGMPVVMDAGVTGQVMNISPHYSKILLANDPNSAIDVLVQETRVQGIVKGAGREGYRMHYVLKNDDVHKGNRIVTSGLGGVFPKGLQVGTVTKIVKDRRGMFQKIFVEPAVDFSKLEYLVIILKRDSLAE
ncbi:MAG: rod shape-determining protein MreC [Thermodesulfobacteriota bacterium]|nr:rod shape-determining protein MreC [Thermodesulfobacteriota bacterium]